MESYTMLSRFLKNRREKKNDKTSSSGKKKKGGTGKDDKSDTEDKDEHPQTGIAVTEIDEEGYTLRPTTTCENDKSSFYSSSDSDDEKDTKFRVEIKPLRNGTVPLSASVDELRTTMENMSLSAVGTTGRSKVFEGDAQMKRSQSCSQQIGNSSPLMRNTYSPLSPPIPPPTQRASPKILSNNTSRYCELGDIFSEVGEIQPQSYATSHLTSQRNTPTPTSGLKAIPRPPLRSRQEVLLNRTLSPLLSAVQSESETSGFEAKSFGDSIAKGPSADADDIPLAIAFHEIVHACFRGNDENQCQVKMAGEIMISFPAGIIQVFTNNPRPAQLKFNVKSNLELINLVPKDNLLNVQKDGNDLTFSFDMNALILLLKKYAEDNPGSSYFNVDILKYHILPKSGVSSCPLHLVAFWKFDKMHTDLRIDYKYNSGAMKTTHSETIKSKQELSPLDVCIAAHLDGGVTIFQSKPTCQWFAKTNRACWKIAGLSSSAENLGVGCLRARFDLTDGPSSQTSVAAQFSCENATLSGSELKLLGSGYRVSLIKKRFVSGKYTCEAQSNNTINSISSESCSRVQTSKDPEPLVEPPSLLLPTSDINSSDEVGALFTSTKMQTCFSSSNAPSISVSEILDMLEDKPAYNYLDSRGPSPLTMGLTDTIPLAVAFHEIVHACFKGNDESQCQVTITGVMMLSFPAGIIQAFINNPAPVPLSCRIKPQRPLDNLVSNQELVNVQKDGDDLMFDFDMSALTTLLKKHAEENSSASYFNVDILKYHILPKYGVASCPLHLVAFWKCEKLQTDLRIDYKYNSHAMAHSDSDEIDNKNLAPLIEVCIAAPVDGNVKSMQSKPMGQWFPNTNRACWKLPRLSPNENDGVGSLRARFEVTDGPSSQGTIAAKFSCENSILSGAQFILTGSGYRVSLVKKRFISGKYTCDTDIFKNGELKENINHT